MWNLFVHLNSVDNLAQSRSDVKYMIIESIRIVRVLNGYKVEMSVRFPHGTDEKTGQQQWIGKTDDFVYKDIDEMMNSLTLSLKTSEITESQKSA